MPLVFDLTLHENDTLYIGSLMDIAVSPSDGSFFVADGFAGRIVRFDRTGEPIQVYGRKGSGPGELMRPGNPILFWDTLLVTGDRGPISVFRLDDGGFVRKTEPLPGSATSGKIIEGAAWFGVHNHSTQTALALLSSPTAEPRYFFPLPREYQIEPALWINNLTSVAEWDGLVVVGISGIRKLWVTDKRGKVRDSLVVPAVRRRGVPENVVEVFRRVRNDTEAFEAISTLWDLWPLPDGGMVRMDYDTKVVDLARYILGTKAYVSVLSSDLKSACVDYLVADAPDYRPRFAWRGDTLFLASPEIQGDGAVTRIQGFRIDTAQCDWIPVG